MREAGVAWRSVFARVRDESARGTTYGGARGTTYGGGFLGVASLVKVRRGTDGYARCENAVPLSSRRPRGVLRAILSSR